MWRAVRVWQRDFKVWTKYSAVSIVSNLGEPVFYILAIGMGLGKYVGTIDGVPYLMFLGPAILASSVMNAASFETTFSSYTRMTVQKTFEGIMVTPLSASEVVAGEILWGASKAVLTGVCMLVVLMLFGLVADPLEALFVLPVIMVSGFLFASFGMLVTAFARSYDFFAYYFTLVLGPMFFFSGTFFPLSELPPWALKVAWFLPLSHSVQLMREIIFGRLSWSLLENAIWLIVCAAILFVLALNKMRRRLTA